MSKLLHLPKHTPITQVVLDSISPQGIRLTTFKLRYWRPIHSELMTHRDFSRCAGSSRARPSLAIIDQVMNDPWGPVHFGQNKKGMQSTELLHPDLHKLAETEWVEAARSAAKHAKMLLGMNVHKQFVNRQLEPYTFIDVVVSSTRWNNFWALRDEDGVDPTMRELAQGMRAAFDASTPNLLQPGEWHLPFIIAEDYVEVEKFINIPGNDFSIEYVLRRISAARCARTSYKAFDGTVAPIAEDLRLFNDLVTANLVHASPTEHQATPDEMAPSDFVQGTMEYVSPHLHGNFDGWVQHRKTIAREYVPG